MKKHCCINGCQDISKHKELYSLPSHYRLKQSWLANIRDKINGRNVELNGNIVLVCHLHFKPAGDFSFVFNGDGSLSKHLEQNAVPSVFPQNAEEWQANLISHQQLDQPKNGLSRPLDNSSVITSGEDAVQLGDVESWGIIASVAEEQVIEVPQNSTQAILSSPREGLARSPDIAKKSFLPRLGNSPSLPSRLQYSCANCDFKTTDAILLRDHREKQHSKRQLVENVETSTEHSNCVHGSEFKEDVESLRKSIIPLSDGHHNQNSAVAQKFTDSTEVDDDIEHLCNKCSFVTVDLREFSQHQRTHDSEGSSTEELSDKSDDESTGGKPCHTTSNEVCLRAAKPEIASAESKTYGEDEFVYCCPICEYWSKSIISFHSHLIVTHNKSGTFKCSRCDFTSVKRRSITKHVSQMQREGAGGHDDAVWVMVAAAENLDYSQYLKPAASSKALQNEKQCFLVARAAFDGLDHGATATNVDYSLPVEETKYSSSFFDIGGENQKDLPNSVIASDSSPKPKSEDRIHVENPEQVSCTAETNGQSCVEECISPVENSTPLRKLLRLCRVKKRCEATIMKRMKIAQEKLEDLSETKKRGASDERAVAEEKEDINQRASALKKEKIRLEYEIRKHQCEILRRKITLWNHPTERNLDDNLIHATIEKLESVNQQLEPRLETVQLEIQELELKDNACAEQLKEITDSNAGIEQLISITQSEIDDDEPRLSELRKELAILHMRLRRATSQERSRIKIATTVQRAKAARDYKRRLLLIQEKERKRLGYLDKLLYDGNFET